MFVAFVLTLAIFVATVVIFGLTPATVETFELFAATVFILLELEFTALIFV